MQNLREVYCEWNISVFNTARTKAIQKTISRLRLSLRHVRRLYFGNWLIFNTNDDITLSSNDFLYQIQTSSVEQTVNALYCLTDLVDKSDFLVNPFLPYGISRPNQLDESI